VRIDPDRRDVVDHRKLARALLRLAQAEYDVQHDARPGLPPPPRAPVEAPVRPRAPDGAPSDGVAGQAATPAKPAAPGSTGGEP
jgi:hypothetical protein